MKYFWIVLMGVAGWISTAHAATRFVDLNAPHPSSPYSSWTTAARNIQAAVDAASDGDLILITNGVYRASSAVVINKAITLRSVGSEVTSVDGGGTHRCFELDDIDCRIEGLTNPNRYIYEPYGGGGGIY
jgi:hypothetical protein